MSRKRIERPVVSKSAMDMIMHAVYSRRSVASEVIRRYKTVPADWLEAAKVTNAELKYRWYLRQKGYPPRSNTFKTYAKIIRGLIQLYGDRPNGWQLQQFLEQHPFPNYARAVRLFTEMWGDVDKVDWDAVWRRIRYAERYGKPKRVKNTLRLEDLAKLIDGFHVYPDAPRPLNKEEYAHRWEIFRAIAAMQILTGCRAGDAIRLDPMPEDRGVGRIQLIPNYANPTQIRIKFVLKRGKELERTIFRKYLPPALLPVYDALVDHLQQWAVGGEVYGRVFRGEMREGTAYRQYLSALHFVSERVLGRRISTHDIRRSFITQLLNQGAPLPAVQQFVGHNDIRTTAKYYVSTEIDKQIYSLLKQGGEERKRKVR